MSWLQKISSELYFIIAEPAEFYEWKFTGQIPKGTLANKHMPTKDVITKGSVIISAFLPPSHLKEKNDEYVLSAAIIADPQLHVGQIQSPVELFDKFRVIGERFNEQMREFRRLVQTKSYFLSNGHLYKISGRDEHEIEVQDYGLSSEIMSELKKVSSRMRSEAAHKTGRSYELANYKKLNDIVNYLGNPDMPIDDTRLDNMIRLSKITPVKTFKMKWNDFACKVRPETQEIRDTLHRFSHFKWIAHLGKENDQKN